MKILRTLATLLLVSVSCRLTGESTGEAIVAAKPASTSAAERRTRAELEKLRAGIADRARAYRTAFPRGLQPAVSTTIEEARLALAWLQIEQGFDHLAAQVAAPQRAALALAKAREILQGEGEEEIPDIVSHGRLQERAYFARNDASPQPYYLFQPTAPPANGTYPLVVFLHGYVPDTSRTNPYLVADFVLDLAEERNALLVIPHGRTNTDFQDAGEVDVLRVIAEVETFHAVDTSRIYLLGISMGGAGVWHLATHYPDRFAAVAPINAQGDWFRFWRELFRYPAREDLPFHIQYLIAKNNPLDLAGNLKNLYSYSQHASRCFVGPAHTQAVVERLKAVGAPHDYFEDPSELGHYIYWRPDCWQRAFDHLFRRQAPAEPPRQLQYSTYSLRFPGAYWVRITRIAAWGKQATVDATFDKEGRVRLATRNVASLTLTPPAGWLPPQGGLSVVWNDIDIGERKLAEDGALVLTLPRENETVAEEGALVKTEAVCGPAADVFNFPFLIVLGTRGKAEIRQANAALAERIAQDWFEYAEGRVEIIRDTDVTEDVMRQYGLVLVGFADENAVFARFADRLPIQVDDETISLAGGPSYPRTGSGLIMTHPNPAFPQRYLLVYAGLHWGAGRSDNHRFDCIPDFAIYTSETVPPVGYNRYYAAGLFDENWAYRRELTDFGISP